MRNPLPVLAVVMVALSACGGSGSADTPTDAPAFDGVGEVPPTVLHASRDQQDEPSSGDPSSAGGTGVGAVAEGDRMLVLGDSILESTKVPYGAAMCSRLVPQGWSVGITAENGRHVDDGLIALDEWIDEGWDAAVVMLGSNYDGDQQPYEQQLGEIVERLAPRPTVLLTVTEFTESRREVNDSIRRVADQHENTLVIDWAAETAEDGSLLGDDGLHLSDVGKLRITELIADAMGEAPGGGTDGECLDPEPFDPSLAGTTDPVTETTGAHTETTDPSTSLDDDWVP